jgi:cystathionine beta-lyase/cystathionine gamma-synthase
MSKDYRFETDLIHAGEPKPLIGGAATLPIFQSSVFEYSEGRSYHEISYPRLNNLPNQIVLSRKLAVLEGGADALVVSSGMAAITTTLLAVLKQGDHILVQDCLYGGTYAFFTKDIDGFGISFDFIDGRDPFSWTAKLKPNTKAVYVEAITNPLIEVIDHKAVAAFAKKHGLISIIDNTFATPVNFRPLEIGYDISLHSCTKYLNGHSDLVAGAIIGGADLIERIRHRLNRMGACLDPHACFLLHRGLKTLALRVRAQNSSALSIAKHLASRSEIAKVNYVGLATHPQHSIARELFKGFGGVLSFEPRGGTDAAKKIVGKVRLALQAPSLGGLETLITRPSTTSHSSMSEEEREAGGITDSLIRLSVGIEHTDDIIEDLDQAIC